MIGSFQSRSWLPYTHPTRDSKLRIFCFPYAGGGTSIYRAWQHRFPSAIEVCPVELPGRGLRINEPPFGKLVPLVGAVARALLPYLDKPFTIFGHSMGALIGFELARHLHRYNLPGPTHLFVSAHRAPQISNLEPPIHKLPETAFKEELRRLKGTPEVILHNSELLGLTLPTLRADFEVVETYSYITEEPLNCSILALGGLNDNQVQHHHLAPWKDQTDGTFRLHMFPGDHFFIRNAEPNVLEVIFGALKQSI
jgi:surfactin synthase thioesterase subunit